MLDARRVALAGHRTVLWNRTPAKAQAVADGLPAGSAVVAATPADAVHGCTVVLSMFAENLPRLRDLLVATLAQLPPRPAGCACPSVYEGTPPPFPLP